jgi:GAF domain-containing protein
MELHRLGRLVADLYRPGPATHDGEDGSHTFDSMATRACATCVELLDVSGAGVVLVDEDGDVSAVGAAGSSSATILEEIQFVVGEGPGLDAHASGKPVLVPDLADVPASRWPGFVSGMLPTGVRGLFSFPLHVTAVHLGALDLTRDEPGPLDARGQLDAAVMAEVVTRRLLASQHGAQPEALGVDFDDPIALRLEVHRAAGMVSEQLGIRAADALVLLRAAAYASERPIDALAHEIVTRTLRFDEDPV